MYRSNGNLYQSEFTTIAGWTMTTAGVGSYVQTTFDGKSCAKLAAGSIGISAVVTDTYIGTMPVDSRVVCSANIYGDNCGTTYNGPIVGFYGHTRFLGVYFGTSGSFAIASSGTGWTMNIFSTAFVNNTWQEWTFDTNWTTVDVYLNGVCKTTGVNCIYPITSGTGRVVLDSYCLTATSTQRIVYYDWLKVGTDAVNYTDKGVRFRNVSTTVTVAAEILTATHKVRFVQGGTVYGIPLVTTNDSEATAIRFYDGTSVQSIPKV